MNPFCHQSEGLEAWSPFQCPIYETNTSNSSNNSNNDTNHNNNKNNIPCRHGKFKSSPTDPSFGAARLRVTDRACSSSQVSPVSTRSVNFGLRASGLSLGFRVLREILRALAFVLCLSFSAQGCGSQQSGAVRFFTDSVCMREVLVAKHGLHSK